MFRAEPTTMITVTNDNNNIDSSSSRMNQIQMESMLEKHQQKQAKALLLPRRPVSGYNILFHLERQRILELLENDYISIDSIIHNNSEDYIELCNGYQYTNDDIMQCVALQEKEIGFTIKKKARKHCKTHGKIGFVHLSRVIAKRWKRLSNNETLLFREFFDNERKRYYKELNIYNKKQQQTSTPIEQQQLQPQQRLIPNDDNDEEYNNDVNKRSVEDVNMNRHSRGSSLSSTTYSLPSMINHNYQHHPEKKESLIGQHRSKTVPNLPMSNHHHVATTTMQSTNNEEVTHVSDHSSDYSSTSDAHITECCPNDIESIQILLSRQKQQMLLNQQQIEYQKSIFNQQQQMEYHQQPSLCDNDRSSSFENTNNDTYYLHQLKKLQNDTLKHMQQQLLYVKVIEENYRLISNQIIQYETDTSQRNDNNVTNLIPFAVPTFKIPPYNNTKKNINSPHYR